VAREIWLTGIGRVMDLVHVNQASQTKVSLILDKGRLNVLSLSSRVEHSFESIVIRCLCMFPHIRCRFFSYVGRLLVALSSPQRVHRKISVSSMPT
jgi:hypothetical protein